MRFPLAACLVILATAPMALRADGPAFDGRVIVTLDDALLQSKEGAPGAPKSLTVYATRTGGVWSDVWAESRTFNKAIHEGEVTEGTAGPDRVHLKVALTIAADHWVKGGPAAYDIDLRRAGDVLEGTYRGTFDGPAGKYEAAGRAQGTILPPNPVAAGFTPVEPGEHPRLLFRKSDLPALRQRMQTPFGKGMVSLLETSLNPVDLGVMYQLTGDRAFAERAYEETRKVMANRDGGPFALGRFWGYRTSEVGCAYDLCHDAWDDDQRGRVEDYLDWIIYKCLHRQHRVGTVNWTPGSNYTVVLHAGNGLAALALWGEKGPAPVEPLPPRQQAPRVPPSAEAIPAGVPVVHLEAGKTPTEWLWVGPFEARVLQHEHPYFEYEDPVDCLASAGGAAKVRPEPGARVAFRKQTLEWKPLSIRSDPQAFMPDNGDRTRTILNTSRLSGHRENTRLYFYTVLENDTPGWYEVQAPFYEGRCYLNGVRLAHGEMVHLEKGRYPLLVPVAMADGEYTATIQFRVATEEAATAYYADPGRRRAYEAAKQGYEKELARWKAAGGANLAWEDEALALQHLNYLNLQGGMGDGGFQGEGEGYTLECHHVLHDYACAYQNVFGQSVTGRPDISHFAARYVLTTVWEEADHGKLRAVSQSFGGHGGGTIPARYLGRSIALCPEAWKPALLWYWLRRMGVTAEEVETEAGARRAFGTEEYRDGLALVEAFLHYPLGMKPRNPGEVLPHVWEAATRGFCCFRNSWQGPDDIVAQVYARQGEPCGWNQAEAGCFQIYGLGRAWAWKDNDAGGKTGSRWLDNVVMLPDDPVNAWGLGRVTHFHGDDQTGSGTVTIDLEEVYRFVRPVEGKKGATEQYDGGVRGLRAFAADYSGKAGVPGLFAVVDKITGGKKKVWVWQLPRSPKAEVTIGDNSFTIRDGDASLRATFIGPRGVKIVRAEGKYEANRLSGVDTVPSRALHVTGANDQAGDFFVILTLQRGAAPEVKAEGEGLAAVVTVGEQTVRFDGEKIILGK